MSKQLLNVDEWYFEKKVEKLYFINCEWVLNRTFFIHTVIWKGRVTDGGPTQQRKTKDFIQKLVWIGLFSSSFLLSFKKMVLTKREEPCRQRQIWHLTWNFNTRKYVFRATNQRWHGPFRDRRLELKTQERIQMKWKGALWRIIIQFDSTPKVRFALTIP